MVLVSIREAIALGSLDVQALAMFDSTRRHFATLLPPLRASQLQLYHQVHKIYARFDQAASRSDRLIAIRELQVLLCDVHAPKRVDERGAGLAARHYKDAFGRNRPLQYTLLDVNPLLASPQMRLTALAGLLEHRDQHLRDWWREIMAIPGDGAKADSFGQLEIEEALVDRLETVGNSILATT